jgi:hypothetical protein
MPIPPPCLGPPPVFSPLGGSSLSWLSAPFVVVIVIVVVVELRLDPIQTSSWFCHYRLALLSAIATLSKLSPHPSSGARCCCSTGPARHAPRPCAVIDCRRPWAAWINPSPLPPRTTDDAPSLPTPSPFSPAIVSHPGASIMGASTLLVLLGIPSTQ